MTQRPVSTPPISQRGVSVSFDRAADFYDRTRGLSEQTAAAQTAVLMTALQGVDGPVLEVGVGTGRVALPLAAAGVPVVGVDLSPAMLAQLRSKGGGSVPVACGDATRLPIGDAAVAAVLVAHVLHLVADWRVALAEIERVTRPGGLLLATRGDDVVGPRAELKAIARESAGWTRPAGRLDRLDVLDAELAGRGAEVTLLPPVATGRIHTAAEDLRAITDNLGSWTWEWTEQQRVTAEAAAREFVTTTYGDPESVRVESAPIVWHCYRLPD